ncbi:MAG: glycine betaine/L-proline ABC transporter substrate-binding protein ProX [Desulfobacteraceae bacterium]
MPLIFSAFLFFTLVFFLTNSVHAQHTPKFFKPPITTDPSAGKEIRMARATWDTGWFQAEIIRNLLQTIGYTVKAPVTMDNQAFYIAAAKGKTDLWANGWFPSHNAFIKTAQVYVEVEAVGFEVKAGALQGYMVDKKTATRFGIKCLDDFKDPDIAGVFDKNDNGRADLIGCNAGWGCEGVVEHHLDAFDLRSTVEHLQGDYSPMMDEAVTRFKNGKPVFFYTWKPNWTVGTLVPGRDVVWIEVPFSSLPECKDNLKDQTTIKGVRGCTADPCNMGFPPNDIRVVANKHFLDRFPDVRHLLTCIKTPLSDITGQNAKMLAGEDAYEDIRRHAQAWIKNNSQKTESWIRGARTFQIPEIKSAISQRKKAEGK